MRTYWTTNYDKLLEDSVKAAGKIADVKFTLDHLNRTKPKRDAVVYKMHGDIDHPDDALLTKDDCKRYQSTRGQNILLFIAIGERSTVWVYEDSD